MYRRHDLTPMHFMSHYFCGTCQINLQIILDGTKSLGQGDYVPYLSKGFRLGSSLTRGGHTRQHS